MLDYCHCEVGGGKKRSYDDEDIGKVIDRMRGWKWKGTKSFVLDCRKLRDKELGPGRRI